MGKTKHKAPEDGRPADGAAARRPASPTGSSDAARQAVLQRSHRKLAASFPHAVHAADLQGEELAPSQPGFLMHVRNFLSPEECAAMIASSEEVGLNPPSLKDLRPRKGEALLNRESFAFEDPLFGAALWTRMERFLPRDVSGRTPYGVTSRLRYYKYSKGHSFGQHVDQLVKGEGGSESEYTALFYLNGQGDAPYNLAGGETVFWKTAKEELHSFSPTQGSLLLHAHGRRCLMHEGLEVTKGCKHLFRCDVLYSSPPPR
ncbi:hypothetical protein T484DRAFT_1884033 [Baffinella frigidus]|nr:hypothetical protein T484DRAFT_1884033 [Cryptophyta sp. CCMP2293]